MKKLHPTFFAILCGIACFALLQLMNSIRIKFFQGMTTDQFYGFYASFLLFVLSVPGVFFIVTRRAPALGYFLVIEGEKAVIIGVIWLMLFGLPAAFGFLKSIQFIGQ